MYFITICTKNREEIFSKICINPMQTTVWVALLGDPDKKHSNHPDKKHSGDPNKNHKYNKFCNSKSNEYVYTQLTEIGQIIQINIKRINANNNNVNIVPYVIMPDHIHFIIQINVQGSPKSATPTVPKIINSFKSIVSKEIGYSIWQRGYYEHIIRNEKEYYRICEYIKNIPIRYGQNMLI